MGPRIYANEIELATMYRVPSKTLGRKWDWNQITEHDRLPEDLFKGVLGSYIASDINIWGQQGFRFYQDTGKHPEWALPECSSPVEAAKYRVIAQLFLGDYLRALNNECFSDTKKVLVLVANNVGISEDGGHFNTYGNHVNISFTSSRRKRDYVANLVAPFIASAMTSWDGTGWLRSNGKNGYQFLISQRMPFMKYLVSGNTTNDRGIINTREESHTVDGNFDRLHITGPDTHRSEYIEWLRFATIGLVIGMAEDESWGRIPVTLVHEKFVESHTVANRDFTFQKPVWRTSYGLRSSISIQRAYLTALKEYYVHDGDAQLIIGEFERVLRLLVHAPKELEQEVEWMIKQSLFARYVQRYGIENWTKVNRGTAQELVAIELLYSCINETTLYEILCNQGRIRRIFSDTEIAEAKDMAPASTRAHERGSLISLAHQQRSGVTITSMDWESADVSLSSQHGVNAGSRKIFFRGIPGKCDMAQLHLHVDDLMIGKLRI